MTSPIFGPTATTLAQALAWATQRGAHPRAQAIIPLYYQHAQRYGIPAENGVGQSSWETNDWKYTGQVPPEYRNMCGLKTRRATGDRPEDHARFQSDEMGVIAHLQHLARYGGMQADAVPDPIYDPRFYLVTAFTDTIEGLGGAWAPDPGYGSRVSNRIASLVATEVPMPEYISGLVDVRDKLATNYSAGHGPDEHIPMTEKRGIVVHYGGPPVNLARPSLDILKSYAAYHVSKNWAREGQPPVRGTGLMYHVAVGRDGTKYLCRDLGRVLWHCGAWPQNRVTLAIQTCIGGEQRLTAAQLAALREVCDEWCAATNTPKTEVWGHQELQPTSCPGTVMADFVYPYRSGGDPVAEGHYFPETSHFVGGGFWSYWTANGGLFVFGYPLTEELQENGRTVQYFERVVFEFHDENQEPYRVLLRRLGADALARKAA